MVDRAAMPAVEEVADGDERFAGILQLADAVLDQRRALLQPFPSADESHILGAFVDNDCVGFLRYLIQVIGSDVGRAPMRRDGVPLREGYVEAFGVAPDWRRRGVGTALQQRAIDNCRAAGCYQMRSRSPLTSTENYALKLGAGYLVQPSEQNDSYYFLLPL